MKLEMIISIFALIVSILSIYFNIRINNKTLNLEYHKEIFKNYIIIKIPEARKKVHIYNRFDQVEDLVDVLQSLKKDIVFYKYIDNKFYERLSEKITSLEDYLVTNNGKNISNHDSDKYLQEINKKIEDIYECVFSRHKLFK